MIDPFTIIRSTDEELRNYLHELSVQSEKKDTSNSIELGDKIVLLSDAQTIAGELLARFDKEYEDAKAIQEVNYGKEVRNQRALWQEENIDVKCPAATYFDRIALENTLEEKLALNEKKKILTSFRKIYNNYETRINALKRLQDRVSNLGF